MTENHFTDDKKALLPFMRRLGLVGSVAALLLLGAGFMCVSGPARAETTTTVESTSVKCPDEELQKIFLKNDAAQRTRAEAVIVEGGREILDAQTKNPLTKSRGSFQFKYCIDRIELVYDSIMAWLASGQWYMIFVQALLMILEEYLNAICELIEDAISAGTELLCIPVPDIIPDLPSLPGLEGTTCNGVSLADYVEVTPAEPIDLGSISFVHDFMKTPFFPYTPQGNITLFSWD